jgi:hypothetical protein
VPRLSDISGYCRDELGKCGTGSGFISGLK